VVKNGSFYSVVGVDFVRKLETKNVVIFGVFLGEFLSRKIGIFGWEQWVLFK
jgi:hypothetical protein